MNMDFRRYTHSIEDVTPSFFSKGRRFEVLQGKTQLEFGDNQPMDYFQRMIWPCQRIHSMDNGSKALDPFVNPNYGSIRQFKGDLMNERGFWHMCRDVTKSFYLSKDSPVFHVPLPTVFMAEFVESFVCGTHYGMEALELQLDYSSILNVREILENPDEHRMSPEALDEKFETTIRSLHYKFSEIKKFLDGAVAYQKTAYEEELTQMKSVTSQPTQNDEKSDDSNDEESYDKDDDSKDEENKDKDVDLNIYEFLMAGKKEKSVFRYLIEADESEMLKDAFLITLYYYEHCPESFLNNMYTDALVGQLVAEKHSELVVFIGSSKYMSVYAPLRGRDLITVTTPGNGAGACDIVLSYPAGIVLYSTPKWKMEYNSSLYDWEDAKTVFKAEERHYVQYIMRFNLKNIVDDNDRMPRKVGLYNKRVEDARTYKSCYSVDELEFEYKQHVQAVLAKKRKKNDWSNDL